MDLAEEADLNDPPERVDRDVHHASIGGDRSGVDPRVDPPDPRDRLLASAPTAAHSATSVGTPVDSSSFHRGGDSGQRGLVSRRPHDVRAGSSEPARSPPAKRRRSSRPAPRRAASSALSLRRALHVDQDVSAP